MVRAVRTWAPWRVRVSAWMAGSVRVRVLQLACCLAVMALPVALARTVGAGMAGDCQPMCPKDLIAMRKRKRVVRWR